MRGQYPPGERQQPLPVGGRLDGPGRPDEQRGAEGLFEPPYVPAQRLLGDVQAGGGAGEVQLLGHGDEPAQQPGIHITGHHPRRLTTDRREWPPDRCWTLRPVTAEGGGHAPHGRHRQHPRPRRPARTAPRPDSSAPAGPLPAPVRPAGHPRLHRREPARPAPHGHVRGQRGHDDRRAARLVRPRRRGHGHRPGRHRAGRAVDRPADRPSRAGPDRRPGHPDRGPRLAVPDRVRPYRGTRLDPLRLVRRDGHHPQHRRHVPGPLDAPAEGLPGRAPHRDVLRAGRGRALLHARPGPCGPPVLAPLPRGRRRSPRPPSC